MNNWFSALVLAGLLLGSGRLVGGEKSPLESASPEAARARALAWLKDIGKTDADTMKRFEQVWKTGKGTVLDLLVETFMLGDAKAAEIMKQARDPMTPAPVAVPDILKDAKLPAFFRANLALGYAQALNARRVHEEALQTLTLFGPEQAADPASYLFQRATAENALLLKKPAEQTFKRLLEDVSLTPEHYLKAAAVKLSDMQTWKDKDLGAVARKMKGVERRLALARGGAETQKIQREIVHHLDDLIKEAKAREDLAQKKVVDPKAPKLLSRSDELKLIRALQEKINKSTELLARQYQDKEGEQTSDPNIRRELNTLRERQERIYQVTYSITR